MRIHLFAAAVLMLLSAQANGQTKHLENNKPIYFICPPCNLPCDTMHFHEPGFCPVCGMKLYPAYSEYENKNGEHHDNIDKKVAVLLFPGVEIIDFSGPWEVLAASGMTVFSVATSDTVVQTSMGLKLKPDYTFNNVPEPDIILVPGGNVNRNDTVTVQWIKNMSRKTEHTMSVCTGAFYLAAGGLLDSLKSTTHFSSVKSLQKIATHSAVTDSVRYVDNGKIIVAAGLSSGIDAAFHVVSLYIGKAQTKKLANDLEYRWSEEDQFVRGKLADKYVLGFLNTLTPFDYTMTEYTGNEKNWTVRLDAKTVLSQSELQNLLAYQFENAEGWKKSQRKDNWVFKDNGKNWMAELFIHPIEKNLYSVYLKISQ